MYVLGGGRMGGYEGRLRGEGRVRMYVGVYACVWARACVGPCAGGDVGEKGWACTMMHYALHTSERLENVPTISQSPSVSSKRCISACNTALTTGRIYATKILIDDLDDSVTSLDANWEYVRVYDSFGSVMSCAQRCVPSKTFESGFRA